MDTTKISPNQKTITVPKSIDMHTHTMRSLDGGLTVSKVLKHAISNNISDLAITDHNNIDGVKKAMRYIEGYPEKYAGLNLIPGVEISCVDNKLGAKFHLLVYDFDVNNEAFNKKLEEIRKAEKEHYYKLFTKLDKNFGIKFTPYEIIKAGATNMEITLDVIAEMAVLHVDENGKPAPYAKTKDEFLAAIRVGFSALKHAEPNKDKTMLNLERFLESELENTPYPSLDEILPIIKSAGGIPVIAHLKHTHFLSESGDVVYSEKTHRANMELFLKDFKKITQEYGLVAGMEVCHSSHMGKENYYLDLAEKNQLLVSGGSDFHGPHKSLNHRIGTVTNKYHISKLPLVDYIKNGRKQERVTYPLDVKEITKSISPELRQIYAGKNQSILDKKALKKTTRLNEIITKFGTAPMPIHYLTERADDIKRRNALITLEEEIKTLLASDKEVLNNAKVNRSECIQHFPKLNENYTRLWERLDKYSRLMTSLEKNDTCENKEAFTQYVHNTYHALSSTHKQHLKHRKDMYYVFDIDVHKEVSKLNKLKSNSIKSTTQEYN